MGLQNVVGCDKMAVGMTLEEDFWIDKVGIVRGRHEAAKQERAAQLRREMTPTEKLMWRHLRANRLGGLQFRRQQVIDGFIADFYCHAAGLVVELDGPIHDDQKDYDAERDAILERRGLQVIRFSNGQIYQNLPAVLADIHTAAQEGITRYQHFRQNHPTDSVLPLRVPARGWREGVGGGSC